VLRLLAVTTIALALGAPVPVHDELLQPSFEAVVEETGLPVAWQPWHEPSAAAYSLADAHSGVACVAILDESDAQSEGLRSERVKVEPGVTYRASVWTKILGGGAPGAAVYLEFWEGKQRTANYSAHVSDAEDWTQLMVEHVAPEGAEAATVLVYAASTTMVHSLFDDAALEPVD